MSFGSSPPRLILGLPHLVLVGAALLPGRAAAEVHPDCYDANWGITCFKERVGDAELVDALIAPTLAREGWERACYRVQYLKGEDGGPAAIIVNLEGAAGEQAPKCQLPPELTEKDKAEIRRRSRGAEDVWKFTAERMAARERERASSSKVLRRLANAIKRSLDSAPLWTRKQILQGVDEVIVVDGRGGQAEERVR